jgi:hypothetical protein
MKRSQLKMISLSALHIISSLSFQVKPKPQRSFVFALHSHLLTAACIPPIRHHFTSHIRQATSFARSHIIHFNSNRYIKSFSSLLIPTFISATADDFYIASLQGTAGCAFCRGGFTFCGPKDGRLSIAEMTLHKWLLE